MPPFPLPDESVPTPLACKPFRPNRAGTSRPLLLALTATFLLAAVWGSCTIWSNTSIAPPVATAQNSNAWLEISQPAFEHNLAEVKTLVGPKTQVCAVLKADAYGHGIALLMPSVIKACIPYVGITSNDEAAAVRASGYAGKIMRLRTATRPEIEAALPYNVEELFGNLELAREASAIAMAHHTDLRFHFALNSAGMSRNDLELKTDVGQADALKLLKLPGLTCVGIMAHFPNEDADDVRAGLAVFNRESAWLISAGKLDRSQLLLHTANSFATLTVPESRLDLVRTGSILYGDGFASHKEYHHVMATLSRTTALTPSSAIPAWLTFPSAIPTATGACSRTRARSSSAGIAARSWAASP
jgi:alanine racemase